jgi:glutamate dehydrogenase
LATLADHPAAADAEPLGNRFAHLLTTGAAPGELDDFGPAEQAAAGQRVAAAAAARQPGKPVIQIERTDATTAGRRVSLVLVNDDMPFLVDSTSLAVTDAGLDIQRILHPVIDVRRDAGGRLTELLGPPAFGSPPAAGVTRESVIYMELGRAAGGALQRLQASLAHALAEVRAAVEDWPKLLAATREAARSLETSPAPAAPHENAEDVAFLDWLADNHMTILGHRRYRLSGETEARLEADGPGLGLLRDPATRLWHGLGDDNPETPGAFIARPRALVVTKCDLVSTVHRRSVCDYISVKRFDAAGRVTGEDRIIGLFTSGALNANPRSVPLVRRRVGHIITELGFDPRGHNGKSLLHVLESFPREELFSTPATRLKEMALGLLSLLDRPRPRVFLITGPFGRRMTALVYVPRDLYTPEIREQITRMLEASIGSGVDTFNAEVRSEGLARIHYVFGLGGEAPPQLDEAALTRRLTELVRGWDEALEAELSARVGHTRAARIALEQKRIFSTSYRAQFSAAEAAEDVARLASLDAPGEHAVLIYRRDGDRPGQLRLKLYHLETIISLSDAVPVLERFGFRVIEEFPFDVDSGRRGWVHDFLLEAPETVISDLEAFRARVEPALQAVLDGAYEDDGFNVLVIAAHLNEREVAWLRAYYRYYRQTGATTVTQATVVDALQRNPAITRALVKLFCALHDPAHADANAAAQHRRGIADDLNAVESIDDDRVLRFFLAAIEATLRTNAFADPGREALAFKLDSSRVPGLPAPVPFREIFVYSPRVEGIHLRAGPVARGGLRWSDRRDDFRTEILGLLKAQTVKNAVIVPTGAKGGFYPKNLPAPSNRDAWLAEGTECYRIFIRALLSVTDNIVDGAVVPPAGVVRHDADDPYLVVAADKGTATFSDIANGIAIEHGFWLGDAFASGGSVGYDHKAMGITARGAWVSVRRHFAELGRDVQTQPTTVVGVGDMSGDVFGNGMLLSQALKLVAAFDHRHIFLDPNPDPHVSWAERKRLFDLPRSSWADYDTSKMSPGGGVFPRTQKSIPLSPQVRAVLGVNAEVLAPSELMRAILKAPADLLWLGGIGTYVKADSEAQSDAGDRANDPQRVDATELRVCVVGEGANLGLTQAARVQFARRGGRINTDFIDNSAGVDTSDHEVNIKIALQPVVRAGALSEPDRDALLESMTEAVAGLVLEDNERQTQALSLAERGGAAAVPSLTRLIQTLEETRGLNRHVEGLPGDDLLAQRAQGGEGLTRPELAVLLSYAKLAVYDAIVGSELPDDPVLTGDLFAEMPPALAERFPDALRKHRLRRELIATALSNALVNRGGIAMPFELAEETGLGLAHVAGAFVASRELFGLPQLWAEIDALPPGLLQLRLMAEAGEGLRVQMADVLRIHGSASLKPSAVVAAAAAGIESIDAQLGEIVQPEVQSELDALAAALDKAGAPGPIAKQLVRVQALDGAIATAATAAEVGASEVAVAEAYTMLGARLGLDWAKGRAAAMSPADPWERLLVANAARDLEQMRFDLIARVTATGEDPVAAAGRWLDGHAEQAALIGRTIARAKAGAATTSAMLAHIAAQARAALAG